MFVDDLKNQSRFISTSSHQSLELLIMVDRTVGRSYQMSLSVCFAIIDSNYRRHIHNIKLDCGKKEEFFSAIKILGRIQYNNENF